MVSIVRALEVLNDITGKGAVPVESINQIKRKLESLKVKEESKVARVGVDEFMDLSIRIWQRYLFNSTNRLEIIYHAWTLQAYNNLSSAHLLMSLKVLLGEAHHLTFSVSK